MGRTELRIGNWAAMYFTEYDYSKNCKVEITDFKDIDDGVIKISPIPLTEEWLEKFGAKKIYSDVRIEGEIYWELHNIVFTENEGEFSVMIGELPGVKNIVFNKVHELQNIFSLTGKELEIK